MRTTELHAVSTVVVWRHGRRVLIRALGIRMLSGRPAWRTGGGAERWFHSRLEGGTCSQVEGDKDVAFAGSS